MNYPVRYKVFFSQYSLSKAVLNNLTFNHVTYRNYV